MEVVVLSRNYSTSLGVIRSLGAAGCTVDLVASVYKSGGATIAAGSKYIRNFTEVVTKGTKTGAEDPALIEALIECAGRCGSKPVLFPTDDYTTSVTDKNRSVLESHYIMPTIVGGGDGCLTEYMSKHAQSELAKKAGLRTPREWVISLNEEIQIPEDMVYPCFVKPMESILGRKKEMAKCASEKKLRAHLEKLQSRNAQRDILVQEFLHIDGEINFSGVCLDQQVIIPAIIKKTNVAKYEKGVTLAGRLLPTEELGDQQGKIVHMLRQLHYVGMFDMELSVVDGKPYFNEINLRSGVPNYAYFQSGVNLPALFVIGVLGESIAPEETKISQYGKLFVCEKVAWEDHIRGHMSRRELKDRIAAADILLMASKDDPAPGRMFSAKMKAASNRRKLRRIKNAAKKKITRIKKGLRKMVRPVLKHLRRIKYTLMGYPQMKKANRRKPLAECPRVMVAGRNYSSNLVMARSVGKAGYEVEVLRIFQTKPKWSSISRYIRPDAYSKYVKAFYICVSHRKPKNIVNRLIRLADPYRKMLLIPADDLVANVVDEYMEKLSPYYIMPNVNNIPGELGRLMSKSIQKQLAKDADLPVVNSCVIRTVNHCFEIPETVNYPCFIKPNISKNGLKTRMRRCDSREELEATLTEYSRRKDVEMLVEDFMEIQREYSILGVSTRRGGVAPGFFMADKGGHDARRGVALTGQLVPTAQAQQLIDNVAKFVSSLNFDGLFDVDLIMTPDGKLYFVELNLRFGGSGYAVVQGGANLPGMFADYMLKGIPVDPGCKVVGDNKCFISEKIMLEEYINGYLSRREMKELMDTADIHFIYDPDDPAAYRHFRLFYLAAAVFKRLLSIRIKT